MIEYFICDNRQADVFAGFMPPEVRHREDRESLWYFIAADYELGVLGMLVANPLKDKPQILSVGVSEDYQRRGIGSELISRCCVALKEAGAELTCLCIETPNRDLENFVHDCGFEVLEDKGYRYRVKLSELCKKEHFDRPTKKSEKVLRLRDFEQIYSQRISEKLSQIEVFDGLDWSRFDPDYSLIIPSTEDYSVKTAILCHLTDETVYIDLLYLNQKISEKMVLFNLLQTFYQEIISTYGKDISVEMESVNERSDRLIHYFWENAKPIQTVCEYMKWLY